MAKRSRGPKSHKFRNKLLLNQWLISKFGIDPFAEHTLNGKKVLPFHILSESIKDPRLEGLDHDNLHNFYHEFINSPFFISGSSNISKEQILIYEENIVKHTQSINEKRHRPVIWKYFQWLTLLFTEIYFDKYFSNREQLLNDLNEFVDLFNRHWVNYSDIANYTEDDLNKICFQNATGSGKTLIMHVNLLQYRHYAEKYGHIGDLSRVILITPNEALSEQHFKEFHESNIQAISYIKTREGLTRFMPGLDRVDVLEITKLVDQEGPNTTAARSLGDQNLLLVDEGHRGLSGKNVKENENAWFKNRSMISERGFTFEYSATFEQAVSGTDHEDDYAKSVLFDYSYRWFYEDGFGKDYQILNLPETYEETKAIYLTACLLKFYQQLRIYQDKSYEFMPFNIEKPLWVFVGSTVSSAKGTNDEKLVATDVAQIIHFIADFLENKQAACRRINEILTGRGQDTGLIDNNGNDIFSGAFTYIAKIMNTGQTAENFYSDILNRLFNNPSGGRLVLSRIKGESGEVALRIGTSETPFGLINVGDAKGLCDHVEEFARENGIVLTVEDSDFTEAMFSTVKESSSPINILIGSKKFVEGWDCWRVSTMGLMHVGRSEGAQIIQLFGRGIRLKGYDWKLKRSGHSHSPIRPTFIEDLETLNVFGIEADFMEKFRDFLREEGLPGNERRQIITIPLNVTYDFGKKLKILRPKKKTTDGEEYDFKRDAPIPTVGEIPEYMTQHTVVSDWYPRIQTIQSHETIQTTQKDRVSLREQNLSFLDYDKVFFQLEQFKRERSWHNLNISKNGIKQLLSDPSWYTLYLPQSRLSPSGFDGVLLIQEVASELLKRYCNHYYNYCKREYIEPRLELRELTSDDDNLPQDDNYQLIVDGDEESVIQGIQQIKKELETKKDSILKIGDLNACNFGRHLFQPLFHVRRGGNITILPVALNESEYQFVTDLKKWCEDKKSTLESESVEMYLLRNMSRGKGIGFFEAGNFHPDFILWILNGSKQYVNFIEPHGLHHEGPGSEKVLFHERIKDIEKRLDDKNIILNSYILSWTRYAQLKWAITREEMERIHILFMKEDQENYIGKLYKSIRSETEPPTT